jgi:hypothetical protein
MKYSRHLVWLFLLILQMLGAKSLAAGDTPDPRFDKHWSFQPVTNPAIPEVQNRSWVRNPIDVFILARLQRAKLSPSHECNRRTLIRRVYFDLVGLPPSPQDVDAFVKDPSSDAYEKVVDRLLASPRYGERWARHWLDAVRFAESYGFEENQPRANAWPYRDYVIRSFNDDKPYDQFIREQLAGDAMDAAEATGFLVGGPSDQVKSPDPNLTAQQRMDELHDMVATTGSTFVGLTVGCARCHDHKFDPISQIDYYRMQAIFAGVQHGERHPNSRESDDRLAALAGERKSLRAQLKHYESMPAANSESKHLLPAVVPGRNVDTFAPVEARYIRFTILETSGGQPCIDELEVYAKGDSAHTIALASAGAKATASSLLPGYAIHQIPHINDGLYGNEHSWISNEPGSGWVEIELPQAVTIDTVVWSRDRNGQYTDRLPTRYTIGVAKEPGVRHQVASSDDRVPYGLPVDPRPQYESHSPEEAATLASLLARSRSVEDEARQLSSTLIYAGKFAQPPPTHRLYRGEAMQPREEVAPGAVAAISPMLDLSGDAPEQQRRQAVAQWITDRANPLTARVLVNRLWQHHFGRGIVDTPSDFGHMGARPTHPELLDWLATQFVAGGWKLKPIHRLIVLSATYRQSGDMDQGAAAVDATASLLWRHPPQRLEAEQIRDAILSISGRLDLTMGGPGFNVFKANTNYVRVYTPKDDFGPADWRRMIYQFKPRLQQDGTFGIFDCPDGGQIAPKRASSTTPLQALNLMNSPFMLQQVDFFADRVRKEAGENPETQVDRAFELSIGRDPSGDERRACADLVRKQGLRILCRTLFNTNEFVYVF